MKITNQLQYDNIAELEEQITDVLNKAYFSGINADLYDGLEEFGKGLYLARERYDKERLNFGRTKTKNRKK